VTFLVCGRHKSQHFVPQHYLRAFSTDGRSVRICHLCSGRIVPNGSIKDQSCRDYFYGKDRRIEHALAHMEGGDEAVPKQLRESSGSGLADCRKAAKRA
jgi:hypothetical protein